MSQSNNTLKQLAQNIKENPNDSFSKFALALEFRKQSELNKARILFEDILENDPDYVGVYYHLGKLYNTLERLSDAEEIFRKGIKIASKKKETRTQSELQEALLQVEIEIEERQNQ